MRIHRVFIITILVLPLWLFGTEPCEVPLNTVGAAGEAPETAGSTPRIRRRQADPDAIAILPNIFMKDGSSHVDWQIGDGVWNSKKGWKRYRDYAVRERQASMKIRDVEFKELFKSPKQFLKKVVYNSQLKPMLRYELDLSAEQKEAIRDYLKKRDGIACSKASTCVNESAALLKETLGVQVPFLESQVPSRFARWLEDQSKSSTPVLKFKKVEAIGSMKFEYFRSPWLMSLPGWNLGIAKKVLVGVSSIAGLGAMGVGANLLLNNPDDDSKKKENEKKETVGQSANVPDVDFSLVEGDTGELSLVVWGKK